MAEVYLAKTEGAGRFEKRFAVKRLLSPFSHDPRFVAMFEQEANLFSLLDHPNIAQVYDFLCIDETYLLVMEYIDGTTAAQLLPRLGDFPQFPRVATSVFMVTEVLKGLEYAHHKIDEASGRPLGITHRDISPQNLMLSRNGVMKIIDFGIARVAISQSYTRPGTIKGKLGYSSPEQIEGLPVDTRTDIYSTAVVLYEFLTGRHLFSADNEGALIRKIIEGILPDFTQDPLIPPPLAPILTLALAKHPDHRLASAGLFAARLEDFLRKYYDGFGQVHLAQLLQLAFPLTEAAGAGPGPAVGSEDASAGAKSASGVRLVKTSELNDGLAEESDQLDRERTRHWIQGKDTDQVGGDTPVEIDEDPIPEMVTRVVDEKSRSQTAEIAAHDPNRTRMFEPSQPQTAGEANSKFDTQGLTKFHEQSGAASAPSHTPANLSSGPVDRDSTRLYVPGGAPSSTTNPGDSQDPQKTRIIEPADPDRTRLIPPDDGTESLVVAPTHSHSTAETSQPEAPPEASSMQPAPAPEEGSSDYWTTRVRKINIDEEPETADPHHTQTLVSDNFEPWKTEEVPSVAETSEQSAEHSTYDQTREIDTPSPAEVPPDSDSEIASAGHSRRKGRSDLREYELEPARFQWQRKLVVGVLAGGLFLFLYGIAPGLIPDFQFYGTREASVGKSHKIHTRAIQETCLLDLSTDPALAEVFVNDVRVGQTPFVAKVPCVAAYTVRFEKSGFTPVIRKVRAGEIVDKLEFTLTKASVGQVEIWMDFNASLFVDGAPAGLIAPSQTFKVLISANQKHELRIKNEVLGIDQIRSIQVTPDSVVKATLLLTDLIPGGKRRPASSH